MAGRVGARNEDRFSGGAAAFSLSALFLEGAVGWGLCGKSSTINVLG